MWFWFSLIALICWSGSDLFSKIGCQDADDKYSHLKMVMAVGLVMGLHAAYEIFINGTEINGSIILTYLPVSLLYISSMTIGYIGLRYIELSISSPICNSSGALVAVLALFLYGMQLMGDGLKKGSSGALKAAMEKVTNNPLVGFLLGLAVTAVIQSSTATIVLTSGLVGAGVLTLHQSIGIILGANVGSGLTAAVMFRRPVKRMPKPIVMLPTVSLCGVLMAMMKRMPAMAARGASVEGLKMLSHAPPSALRSM